MTEDIVTVKRRLRMAVISFVLLMVLTTAGIIYIRVSERLDTVIDQAKFEQLITSEEALDKYYQDQAGFEAHFVTAANLIRKDQLNSVLGEMTFIILPMTLVTILFALLISKKLIDPIEDAYRSKKLFIQDAAHELRNPLGAIDATVQNVLEEKCLSVDAKKSMEGIQRQVKQLITLSNDLIYLERASEGEKQDLDLAEVTRDVIDQMTHLANQHHVKIELESPKHIPFFANLEDMVILVRNVLANSIKYSKEQGGTVKIVLKSSNKGVSIQVEDNGIGMSTEDLDRVGERFFRAGNAIDRNGSGLGLSIVQKIVHKYSGSFDIQSTQNVGTTVILQIYD